jgi:hypothetical protein
LLTSRRALGISSRGTHSPAKNMRGKKAANPIPPAPPSRDSSAPSRRGRLKRRPPRVFAPRLAGQRCAQRPPSPEGMAPHSPGTAAAWVAGWRYRPRKLSA